MKIINESDLKVGTVDLDQSIVCALCGKRICRSEKSIGLLAMHYKKTSHQRILKKIQESNP